LLKTIFVLVIALRQGRTPGRTGMTSGTGCRECAVWGLLCWQQGFLRRSGKMNKAQPLRRGLLALGSGAIAGFVAAPRPLNALTPPPAGRTSRPVIQAAAQTDGDVPRQEVRSGVVIAYADQWFGAPWQDGEPILLLHGVAESHVAWQQWVPLLAGRFRVLRPDLPGFGQSPLPASYDCTTQQVAGDLMRLLDALLGRITAPTLVVTTESSPLQPVAAARLYQEKIAHSKLLVLPGDSYHIAAVHPQECARQLLEFIGSA
jgi:alpha/beta hydrolase fold